MQCCENDEEILDVMEQVDQVGRIHSVRCNCDGTKISFLAESLENGGVEPKLFVYDDFLDKFLCYDFGNRRPVSHCWDVEDCRLIACQTICSEVSRRQRVNLMLIVHRLIRCCCCMM